MCILLTLKGSSSEQEMDGEDFENQVPCLVHLPMFSVNVNASFDTIPDGKMLTIFTFRRVTA